MTVYIAAILGSLGFGLMLGNRGIKLAVCAAGAALCWGAYLLCGLLTESCFLQVLGGALIAALFAEFAARRLRAPSTVFSLIAAMPLVPGAGLYHTLSALLSGDRAATLSHGSTTLWSAAGIAVGIVTMNLLYRYASRLLRRLRAR